MAVQSLVQDLPVRSRSRSERRRYERYAVRCDCWLERDEASIYGPTADVGLGGLFLRTAVPIPHGHPVDVVLTVAGGSVKASGVVTRAVPPQQGTRHGVGVEFLEISAGESALLDFLGKHAL